MRPGPRRGRAVPLGAAARRDPVRALPGPGARPDRDQPRGGQAAQGLPAPRHRGDRRRCGSRPRSNARPRPRCGSSSAARSNATRARWRSSTRSGWPTRRASGGRDGPPAKRRRRWHRRGRVHRHAGGQGRRPGCGRPDGGPPVRDRRRAALSRVGPGARAARRPVGRRPARRLAAVGPRPARSAGRAARWTCRGWSTATSRSRSSPRRRSRRATSTSSATTTAATTSSCWPSRSAGRPRRGAGSCRAPSTSRAVRTASRHAPRAVSGSSGPAADLAAYEVARRERPAITAGLLAIEGAHALDGDPANVEVVADAGFRMMSPSHFFDNAFGGSAHGVAKTGLTDAGREMIRRMEARGMLVDVAHASVATIDDVLAMAARPVVASHTGLCGIADNPRNLTDEQARAIAATGGVIGIGFWPTACGGRRRRRDRPDGPLRRRCRRSRARRSRLGLRRGGPGAVRRDRAGPADGRAHRRRPGRRGHREGHGRQRPPAAGRRAALSRTGGPHGPARTSGPRSASIAAISRAAMPGRVLGAEPP